MARSPSPPLCNNPSKGIQKVLYAQYFFLRNLAPLFMSEHFCAVRTKGEMVYLGHFGSVRGIVRSKRFRGFHIHLSRIEITSLGAAPVGHVPEN